MRKFFLLVSLLILADAQAAGLYRSIDRDGNVHYSDRPLPGAEDVTEVKAYEAPAADESLPYETRRAMENFPVTLYSYPDCGSICQQARDVLNQRGVPFTEKSLKTKQDVEAFSKASGDKAIPKLTVGRTWIKGFVPEQLNKELDIAGYPKTAPYRARPATPPVPEQPAQSEQAAQPEQPAQPE